ncbi:MAG: aminoglycoside phosphotransferase [Hoeflea sp. BRH_c9]|nr:MAG: aminoglycoside phosphotransferase [Hoeflea sp. BRH_c9]
MSAGLDQTRLDDWLQSQDLGRSVLIERISGGQSNPTFFVDTDRQRIVLRKKPDGKILPGAHAIEREYRAMSALFGTGVPVPQPLALCEDEAVLGTAFYVMQRLEGRVFHDAALPGVSPDDRRAIYLSMAETLAKLHAVDPAAVGLGDFGRPAGYFERQHKRWLSQWQQAQMNDIPEIDQLADWLASHMPADDGIASIVHGDFRIGNLLYAPDEPRVIGILDWELATLGHPLADLGFCCMTWRTTPDEYGGINGLGDATPGLPARDEFIAHYMEHANLGLGLKPFHEAFAFFRFAVIFVGIAERARLGNAADPEAVNLAPLARRFAARGLEAIGR